MHSLGLKFHIAMVCGIAAILMLSAAAARTEPLQSGAVLDAVIEAYGGAAAMDKLKSMQLQGEVTAAMRGRKGIMRRDFLYPDNLFVEISYPDETERRYLAGQDAWRGTNDVMDKVEGPPRLAMVYQMLRSGLPGTLLWHRNRLEYGGLSKQDSGEYHVFRLRWSRELEIRFWVNSATRLIDWVQGDILSGPQPIPFATRYLDFRTVDGVLVPFSEENYASGVQTGTTRIKDVAFKRNNHGPFSLPKQN